MDDWMSCCFLIGQSWKAEKETHLQKMGGSFGYGICPVLCMWLPGQSHDQLQSDGEMGQGCEPRLCKRWPGLSPGMVQGLGDGW